MKKTLAALAVSALALMGCDANKANAQANAPADVQQQNQQMMKAVDNIKQDHKNIMDDHAQMKKDIQNIKDEHAKMMDDHKQIMKDHKMIMDDHAALKN